uniref:Uncharacterized protein n=1 Tax=Octopus bimaculoides TaxID=37653 RepID=A0A0L8G349_OCTBM
MNTLASGGLLFDRLASCSRVGVLYLNTLKIQIRSNLMSMYTHNRKVLRKVISEMCLI